MMILIINNYNTFMEDTHRLLINMLNNYINIIKS